MAWRLHTSVFGQILRLVSKNKLFRYPDEIDPALWKKAILQDTMEYGQERTSNAISASSRDDEEKNSSAQRSTTQDDHYTVSSIAKDLNSNHETLLVGWYGSDDPEVRYQEILVGQC